MTLSWSPDPDAIDYAELTQTVSVIAVTPDGTETEYTGVTACVGEITQAVTDAGGIEITPAVATWILKVSDMSSAGTPGRGWRVVSTTSPTTGTWVAPDAAEVLLDGTQYRLQRTQKVVS